LFRVVAIGAAKPELMGRGGDLFGNGNCTTWVRGRSRTVEALQHAEAEGRICPLKVEPGIPVHTAWDLGRSDTTAIWFIQYVRPHYHLVGYYESSGAALHHYVEKLAEFRLQNKWKYGRHFFPHDVANHGLISVLSRRETLEGLGIDMGVVPAHNVLDGVNAVRRMLDRTRIDRTRPLLPPQLSSRLERKDAHVVRR
jgi:hypothetical protein